MKRVRPASEFRPLGDLPLFADAFARAVRVPDYDVCERRHGGNAQSDAANDRAAFSKQDQRRRVLVAIRAAGLTGITCKELARALKTGQNNISGRFSELRKLGLIRVAKDDHGRDRTREGCAVYVAC